jgi:Flp pilus assembly protein TadG
MMAKCKWAAPGGDPAAPAGGPAASGGGPAAPAGESAQRVRGRGGSRLHPRRRKQLGQNLIEFVLVIGPTLMLIFFVLDLSWETYQRASLQYAVAEGVRYAITYPSTGGLCAAVRNKVESSAPAVFGFTGATAASYIHVRFLKSTSTGTLLKDCSSFTSGTDRVPGEQDGWEWPLVQVTVEGVKANPLMPVLNIPGLDYMRALVLSAQSWDRMEPLPPGQLPPFM